MKNKTILPLVILSSLVLIALIGCSGTTYPFKEPIDEIQSIEIVSAENSLDYTVIKTLSETEKGAFLEEFQKVEFRKYLGDPPGVHGDAIRITYQSGVYEMICYFASEYVVDGRGFFHGRSCGEKAFEELLETFLHES